MSEDGENPSWILLSWKGGRVRQRPPKTVGIQWNSMVPSLMVLLKSI